MRSIEQNTPKNNRGLKFLLILPVLAVPFLASAFWALGGGRGKPENLQETGPAKGFNMNLPPAHFAKKESALDKLGFYRKADEDSVKLMERIKMDPYHKGILAMVVPKPIDPLSTRRFPASPRDGSFGTVQGLTPAADHQADQLLVKLEQLKRTIRPQEGGSTYSNRLVSPPLAGHTYTAPETSRLESLVETMRRQDTPAAPDSQMERLNGMLDKIIRIQHPVKDEPIQNSGPAAAKPAEFHAVPLPENLAVSIPDTLQDERADSSPRIQDFYIIDGTEETDTAVGNTIPAVIEGDQTIVSGSTVTLRLSEDCIVDNKPFPRDNLLYGTATIKNDRIQIMISSIQCENSIYPVALQVYDLDGLMGIHISNGMTRDVAKQSAADAVNTMELGSFDPSVGAQAANAGIQAAKTLFGRKIKLAQASIEAGYPVLLKASGSGHK